MNDPMKKITLLTAFVTVCSSSFAQTKTQQTTFRNLSKAGTIETVDHIQQKGTNPASAGLMKKAPVFSEDFEGLTGNALPAGWTKSSSATDGGFYTGDNTETRIFTCIDPTDYFPIPAHTDFAMTHDDCCNCDKSVDYLEMPGIDL